MHHYVPVDDKCCLCIPIRAGLTILGVLSILSVVGTGSSVANNPMYGGPHGGLLLAASIVQSIGFLGWMSGDSQASRHRLHRLMWSSLLLQIAGDVLYLARLEYYLKQSPALRDASSAQIAAIRSSTIGGVVLGALLQLYFIRVARRFAGQWGMENKQGNFASA